MRRVGSYFFYGIVLVLWTRSWISNIKIRIEHSRFCWKISATTTATTAAATTTATTTAAATTATATTITATTTSGLARPKYVVLLKTFGFLLPKVYFCWV